MEKRAERLIELFSEIIEQQYTNEKTACENTPLCSLNTNDLKVLLSLQDRKNPSIKDIADDLSLPMSTLTGIFNKLVNRGFVIRERCASDRRVVRVRLTEAGSSAAELKKKMTNDFALTILSSLSTEEQEQLLGLLEKITDMSGVPL